MTTETTEIQTTLRLRDLREKGRKLPARLQVRLTRNRRLKVDDTGVQDRLLKEARDCGAGSVLTLEKAAAIEQVALGAAEYVVGRAPNRIQPLRPPLGAAATGDGTAAELAEARKRNAQLEAELAEVRKGAATKGSDEGKAKK